MPRPKETKICAGCLVGASQRRAQASDVIVPALMLADAAMGAFPDASFCAPEDKLRMMPGNQPTFILSVRSSVGTEQCHDAG